MVGELQHLTLSEAVLDDDIQETRKADQNGARDLPNKGEAHQEGEAMLRKREWDAMRALKPEWIKARAAGQGGYSSVRSAKGMKREGG